MVTTPTTKLVATGFAGFLAGAALMALSSGSPDVSKTTTSVADVEIPAAAPDVGDNSTVIAKVNGKELTLNAVKEMIKTMPEQVGAAPLEQVFPMVQDQLVMGTVISDVAAKEGLDKDPEVLNRLVVVRDNVVRATYLERAVKAKMTDDVMKKEYDSFVKSFQPMEEVSAQHILVDDEKTAGEIIAKLKDGAKFEDLVKEYSKDKGAKGDGDLGYFRQGDMVKEFSDAAFGMKKNTVSTEPVKTSFGFHVIKVNDRRMSKPPAFDEMKPQIMNKLQREILDSVIGDLRKGADIQVFDMNGKPVKADAEKEAAEPAEEKEKAAE